MHHPAKKLIIMGFPPFERVAVSTTLPFIVLSWVEGKAADARGAESAINKAIIIDLKVFMFLNFNNIPRKFTKKIAIGLNFRQFFTLFLGD